MKKSILSVTILTCAACILTCAACIGQNSSLNYAKILDSSSDTVYIGDSVYVDIYYYYAVPQGFTAKVNIQVSSNLSFADLFTFRHLDSVPHVLVYNNNTSSFIDCARASFVIPFGSALGQTFYYCNGLTHPVFVAQHLTTNISLHKPYKQIREVKYYNIMGQETNDLKGLIIERIFYSDNSIKTNKLIKQ